MVTGAAEARGRRYDPNLASLEPICARILARHRATIRVQKSHVATANLARIIGAVLHLSAQKGFHQTTLRDLAEATGLSMGGLYSYFENKNTLLVMILTEVATTAEAALRDAPDAVKNDSVLHLRWLIATHIRLTEDMQPWFVFAYMEAKGFPASARRIAVESELATEQIFADVLARGVAQGRFRVGDVSLTASLIKPLLQDWYVKRSKYRKRRTDVEVYIAAVTTFVERSILIR
ncbi:TetR/AcrR family transcriptional regulator [Methylobacterium planeticum]|uniref:TetR/AcrR family transcriptional regulator n=1 Tax=Methylobacterium planeticum TaxID=2615211 RepID=A0A6N6MW03_9HYPH|nr:TetR/AcrR family transcriptional regulator [Methylobacterium planeticum]KAB1074033.1 TetR/AcrR family transcriptional regulator [Methylobacterium planeticum]